MQKRTLKDSIRTLKNLRSIYHGQLDISVVSELNTVIIELEHIDNYTKSEDRKLLGLRALQVIGVVISVVSNIKELMK